MSMRIFAKIFNGASYAAAGLSFCHSWKTGSAGPFSRGVQAFALVSIFDKAMRALFTNKARQQKTSFTETIAAPFIEEAAYSGVLLTQSKIWMIPRWAVALFTGMTAARSLTGRVTPQKDQQNFTLDAKIGFLWAIAREFLLWTLPASPALIVLTTLDSCVFALAEVCPKEDSRELPPFSGAWSYKVLTAAFFRFTANTAAKTQGIAAPLLQHLLWNISRALSA